MPFTQAEIDNIAVAALDYYFNKGDKPAALKELQQALKDNPAKMESEKIKELIAKIG